MKKPPVSYVRAWLFHRMVLTGFVVSAFSSLTYPKFSIVLKTINSDNMPLDFRAPFKRRPRKRYDDRIHSPYY